MDVTIKSLYKHTHKMIYRGNSLILNQILLMTKVILNKKKIKMVKIQLKSKKSKTLTTLIQSELPTFKGTSMLDIQIRKKLRFRVKTG